jgi:hypothetical protein
MEREQFDHFARKFAGSTTRRRTGAFLLALGLGTCFHPFAADKADARNRRRKRKKRKDRGQAACTPNCIGKECGPDGCGGSCGQCPYDYCSSGGQCEDSTCGVCPSPLICIDGQCCDASCDGKVCGTSGCGFSCGKCPFDKPLCVDFGFSCAPIPDLP